MVELTSLKVIGPITAIIVIAVVAIILILGNSQPASNYHLVVLPQVQGSLPAALSGILSQPNSSTVSSLSNTAAGALVNLQQFTATYQGTLYANPSAGHSLVSVSSPIQLGIYKYGNSLKLSLNATSLPILGTGKGIYLNLTNGAFLCTNFNQTALYQSNFFGVLFGNKSISCIGSQPIHRITNGNIGTFVASQMTDSNINLTYQKVYQSIYNGTDCTYISGLISQTASNGTQTGSGLFSECLSDVYYLPLMISFYLNNNMGVFIVNLNETRIGNYSNQQYVDSLPSS